MHKVRRQTLALPSILDRLLDDAPDQTQAAGLLLFELPQFKQGLARDLEMLLNTRVMALSELFESYPLARQSILQFGIPDLSGISLLNPDDRNLLREQLRQAIERYEPRLSHVRVTLDTPRELERHLRFRVDAVLKVHPHRPPVTFDATLQLSSKVYRVQG
ncbi:type VI secretion system baseplate subunit TssE [Formivibrio citricus]|nr:type VI secretion system baseplate subunit TssE [Formivibrio citricus]